jgi:hypothetical protein
MTEFKKVVPVAVGAVTFSLDGRHAWPSTGEVKTRKMVAALHRQVWQCQTICQRKPGNSGKTAYNEGNLDRVVKVLNRQNVFRTK